MKPCHSDDVSFVQSLDEYHSARLIEQYLGSPSDQESKFSFKRSVELDERDEYPEEACRLLEEWNFHHYFIPSDYGGRLKSYEEVFSILRVISRRDLTVAIALSKTYLGAIAVWIGGNKDQRTKIAAIIKNRGQIALALTEEEHGSDLLSSEFRAESTTNGFLLSGRKWLINNGTRSEALTLFARTDPQGGARGFSLFFVEKKALSYSHIPKKRTLGIRGADISGIRFNDCLISKEALIGPIGSGLELMLKSFQVTRTLCASLSLGAADTALRITLDFALSRRLYGAAIFDLPYVQKMLVDSFLDLLVCDCLAIASVRALHFLPKQMSILSAIVKYFVPTTVEILIHNLSAVLGARYYLREGYYWGIFQKLSRDNAIVGLFDGSTVVNLQAIVLQLHSLMKPGVGERLHASEEQLLQSVFRLTDPSPDFKPEWLDLSNRRRNGFLQGISQSLEVLYTLKEKSDIDSEVLEMITTQAEILEKEMEDQKGGLSNLALQYGGEFSRLPEAFEVAKRYCVLNAASACLHMWIYNREQLGTFFRRGEWLALCLKRLADSLPGLPQSSPPRTYTAAIAQEFVELYQKNLLFSIVPLKLA